ncbi:MAG: serine/threonine protein phosphatase [Deltaproteobacteria bacterium]|nr:serine/threonine protein phosphatase [Deltaproteobacteria bacterium]
MGVSAVTEAYGKRIYAIGDVHGCAVELGILLNHLTTYEGIGNDDLVVFLGDYIDRGPDSRGVIEQILEFQKKCSNTRCLRGNHEDMLLDFLGFGGRLGEAFLYNGGIDTVQSYGISVFAPPEEMVTKLPQDHFKFLCELDSIVKTENYIFVHAGINPLRDLYKQNDNDIYWIRDEFINNVHNMKATVVFGHTPHKEIVMHLPYKIGIDTGLVFGNKLTCLELVSGKAMQIYRNTDKVIVENINGSGAA